MRLLWSIGLLALAGCGLLRKVAPDSPPIEELLSDELGRMTNVSVCGDLWVGGQPHREALELASRRGVELILDLSGPGELGFDPVAACRRLEMLYVNAPLHMGEGAEFSQGELNDLLEILAHQGHRAVLMFSPSGSEAAFAFALHRVRTAGLTSEEAVLEARRAGMKPGHAERLLRQQIEQMNPEGFALEAGALKPANGED